MSKSYLDKTGLAHFWEKIKALFLSDKPIVNEDTEPYIYRKSGGNVDVGTKEYDKIVGGSIGWNQLIPTQTCDWTRTGVNFKSNNDGIYTVTGKSTDGNSFCNLNTVTGVHKWFPNHIYLVFGASTNVRIQFACNGSPAIVATIATSEGVVKAPSSYGTGTTYSWMRIQVVDKNITVNESVKPQIFDLTVMFGSTIADYVNTLETATAGSGIAWLKSYGFFTKEYYDYDPGSIKSVDGLTGHRMTEKNLFSVGEPRTYTSRGVTFTVNADGTVLVNGTATGGDAQLEFHYLSGPHSDSNNKSLSGNYYFTSGLESGGGNATINMYCWDEATNARPKMWNGSSNIVNSYTTDFQEIKIVAGHNTIPVLRVGNNQTANNVVFKPMVVRGDITDTTFAPYVEHVYSLNSNVVLNGLPKLNANNELYYDGDIWDASGKITRKYGIVDLGTLTWNIGTTGEYRRFYTTQTSLARAPLAQPDVGNIIMAIYPRASIYDALHTDKVVAINTTGAINIVDSDYESYTASQFKSAMSGKYAVYERAATTIESSTPYAHLQDVDPDGTEEYVLSDDAFQMPVGHTTSYPINSSYKLPTLPDLSPDGDGRYLIEQSGDEMKLTPKHDNASIFYGTCNTAAATAEKSVVCNDFKASDLVPGVTVIVTFSATNSAAAANLTLNVNGTGAKSIKYINNTSIGNISDNGYIVSGGTYQFIYNGTYWFIQYNYNSNTVGEYSGSCIAGPNGMARYSLIMQVDESHWESVVLTSGTGTSKTKNSSGFLLSSPIMYQIDGTYTSGNSASRTACFSVAHSVDSRYSTNGGSSWSSNGKPFYFVGTISNGKFYLKDTNWWTDTLPTSADGYCYWYVGQMSSAYQFSLLPVHPIYYYSDGMIREYYNGNLKGNASTASALKIARNIDGVGFDGSSNITRFGICTSAANDVNKKVTIDNTFSLAVGSMVTVMFSNTNTNGSPTLNVNSTGALPICYKGSTLPTPGCLQAGGVYTFVFDGTNGYQIVGDLPGSPSNISSYVAEYGGAYFIAKEFKKEGSKITFNFELNISNLPTDTYVQIAKINDTSFYPVLDNGNKISFPGLVAQVSGNIDVPEDNCLLTIESDGKIYLYTPLAGQNRAVIISGSYYCQG